MLNEYAEAIVTTAVKWYKGETDHTGLADAIQEYLISQKEQKEEIEMIIIKYSPLTGILTLYEQDIRDIQHKLNEVIAAINQMTKK